MKLYPEYCVNIIVGAITDGTFKWFITEKETWFLDTVAFAKSFSMEPSKKETKIVISLAKGDCRLFMDEIKDYEVKKDELAEWYTLTDIDSLERFAALPSLFVNFDEKVLSNAFSEPSGMFQDYIPEGWVGKYLTNFEELKKLIPFNERYWDN